MQQKKVTKGQIGRIVQLLVSDTASFADAQAFIARHSKKGARKPKTDAVGSKAVALAARSRPLADGEYLVHVGYTMPQDKAMLEAEFSTGGVSELFYGNYEWQNHSSCAEIDQTPGDRVMLVKCFERSMTSEDAIVEMDKLGYRPATHLEAYAFAKANPDLQRQFWIVALGSSTVSGGRRWVAMLDSGSDGRFLGHDWFDREWSSVSRFLFVRKDHEPAKAS